LGCGPPIGETTRRVEGRVANRYRHKLSDKGLHAYCSAFLRLLDEKCDAGEFKPPDKIIQVCTFLKIASKAYG